MNINTLDQDIRLPSVFFKEVGRFIENFLRDNGGDANGMNTYVRGTLNILSEEPPMLDVMTPQFFDQCVIPQIQDAGRELANGIATIAKQYQIEDTIEFVADEFEPGRFGTEFRIVVSAGRS